MFIATRFITGFIAGGVLIAVNILVMELLLPSQRMAVRAVANWVISPFLLENRQNWTDIRDILQEYQTLPWSHFLQEYQKREKKKTSDHKRGQLHNVLFLGNSPPGTDSHLLVDRLLAICFSSLWISCPACPVNSPLCISREPHLASYQGSFPFKTIKHDTGIWWEAERGWETHCTRLRSPV